MTSKRKGKRVSVRTIEAKVGRKKLVILLVQPSMRMALSDEIIDKLFRTHKAGVFCAFRLLPRRKKR
jgi:hypothetical protein